MFPISAAHKADNVDETLDFLAREDLIYTCVDEPQGFVSSIPPIAAATSDIAIVRMHGRNPERWKRRAQRGVGPLPVLAR